MMFNARTLLALVPAALLPLASAGCDEDETTTAGPPRVIIEQPLDGAVVTSSDEIHVRVENFTLVPIGSSNAPSEHEGHIHIVADGTFVGSNGYAMQATNTFTFGSLLKGSPPRGDYTFKVEVRDTNHNPIPNAVADTVRVTYQP